MGIENGSPAAFKHVHRVCVFIHDRVWTSFDRVKYLMVLAGNLLHHHLLHVGRCQPPGRIAAHREKVIGCNLPSLRHSRTPMRGGGEGIEADPSHPARNLFHHFSSGRSHKNSFFPIAGRVINGAPDPSGTIMYASEQYANTNTLYISTFKKIPTNTL